MGLGADTTSLCATCADGCLSVYDIRRSGTKGLIAMSDFQEDELLTMTIVGNGTKVVCGSQLGPLLIFKWGDFGDQKERILGHQESVDCIAKISKGAVLTGSSDGKVRAVAVNHWRIKEGICWVAADHKLPVNQVAISPDGAVFASIADSNPAIQLRSMQPIRRTLEGKEEAQEGCEDGLGDDSDSSSEDPESKKTTAT